MFGSLLGWYTTYSFWRLLPPGGILPGAKFTLRPTLVFSYIASVTARHSSSGRQPNCDVVQGMELPNFRRGRHLYSVGRPSRLASAHILVGIYIGIFLHTRADTPAHVSALCRAGYYQLRQLRPLVQSMTVEAARTAAAAFISCRLDYCNSLLFGLPDTLPRKLQSVQNATARLITGTRRHVRSYHASITWPPLASESTSSSMWRVRQSLSGRAPLYLADDCCLVSDGTQRSLWMRSADVPTCVVPRTLSSYGDRTFAAAGPRLWNSLPVQLCNPDITYGLFRRQRKAHLFREAWTLWRCVTSDMRRLRRTLTYLLTYLLT